MSNRMISIHRSLATLAAAIVLAVAAGGLAHACGWWGDGEMQRADGEHKYVDSDGRLMIGDPEGAPELAELKIPGKMGYGFAVSRSDQATPYLRATGGKPINDIGQLHQLGFTTVVDLATPPETAKLHQAETSQLGMHYFSIPLTGSLPSDEQARRFSRLLEDSGNRPLLVFGPTAGLLGAMWTVHRLQTGASKDAAFAEGRALGMAFEEENDLHWHLRNGNLKSLNVSG